MSHAAREGLDLPSTYFNCKSPILDRRLKALKYSETFKISSRAEASVVLKLTQQLNDSLEQYFLNCKGLEILPTSDYGNRKLGLESTVEKPRLDIEPFLSACTSISPHSLDSLHEKINVTSGEKHTSDVTSSMHDVFLKESSSSGLQSRKLQKFEDPNEINFMSTQSISHRYEEPIPVEVFPSQSCSATSPYYSNTTEHNIFNTHAHVYGPFQVEQNSAQGVSCVSQISLNSGRDVKANSEFKPPVVSGDPEVNASDLGVESNKSDFDASSLHSSSAHEIPASSQAQSKTSKSLSPDIIQLLKGKDASTVTNILKTLSPFYPALQDVNLEILAQVLVNTGALD